ncbi:tetratricopeptide repeat protein [Chryseobacterium sp. M5A1_1a]
MKIQSLSFFILLFVFNCSTASKPENSIENLIDLSDQYSHKDYLRSFIYAKKACILADKNGTSREKAMAYYYMARNLIFAGRNNDCYLFIKKGMNEDAVKNDKFLLALYKELTSNYYSRLYMLPQEMKENKEALLLVDPNNNAESKLFISRIYMWMADCYMETKKNDSAQIYIDKSIKLVEEIPDAEYLSFNRMFRRKAYSYFYQAQIYLNQNNTKSAIQFIDKAYKQAVIEKHSYLYPILEAYGDYYLLSKEYQKAIDYYKKTIDNKKIFYKTSADAHLKISDCYKAMNDISNEKMHLQISSDQRRYDEKMNRINITQVAENILLRETEKKQADSSKTRLIIFTMIILTVLLATLVLYKLLKLKRKQNEILENKDQLLQRKAAVLDAQEKTITILQQKVDDSISELIQMVKDNSPNFWYHFEVKFPDFTGKMLRISPKLKTSELTLSAYIYLGLTTKEISQYTFKSVKTIENNRHNFRKKINIPSEKDLSVWIREYIKNAETEA